jgi:hypothetical protein
MVMEILLKLKEKPVQLSVQAPRGSRLHAEPDVMIEMVASEWE